jgi:hypothetical protein
VETRDPQLARSDALGDTAGGDFRVRIDASCGLIGQQINVPTAPYL